MSINDSTGSIIKVWLIRLALLALLDAAITTVLLATQQDSSLMSAVIDIGAFIGVMIAIAKITVELPIEIAVIFLLHRYFNCKIVAWQVSIARLLFAITYGLFTGMLKFTEDAQIITGDPLMFFVIVASVLSPFILIRGTGKK
ncbi:hypothetical protein CWI80_08865 [Pseudidiomarina sediminum]|uniref:Uncharacterized protein n=1 Tax=Pseudidiomarina sediminum TaxID=431675 RepID=A0A432Z473_9GAMM|nr:hypothetical protein [Pseudidiomarina sediminum]RUO72643.1 hypothetical protein CWI80_08865 [Pseudidiomarina sediminum]